MPETSFKLGRVCVVLGWFLLNCFVLNDEGVKHWKKLPLEVECLSLEVLNQTGCGPKQPALVDPIVSRDLELHKSPFQYKVV